MKKTILLFLLTLTWCGSLRAQTNLSAAAADCNTTNACFSVVVNPTTGAATFTITANASANTVQFEAAADGVPGLPPTLWVPLNVTPSNGTTAVTSTTGTGVWQANVAAYTNVRMRMSALVSGTATVNIKQSTASARSGGGGGGSGEPFGTDTGVANAYVVNPSPAVASLTPNAIVWWKAANTNTAASTINVSGTGVKALTKILAAGTTVPAALAAGDNVAGIIYEASYDGVEWVQGTVGNNPTSLPIGVGTLASSGSPPLILMAANPSPTAGPLLRFALPDSNAGVDFQFDHDQGFVIGTHGGANLNFIAGYVIDWGGMIFQNNTSGAAPGLNIQPQLVESSGNEIHVRDGNAVQLWNLDWNGLVTTTVCTSSASPAVCTRAVSGSVALPAACTPASCLVVNTTAMDAAGVVVVTEDMSLGAKLGVTCNTQSQLVLGGPRVTARVGGTSFTIGLDVAPTTNPMCVNFTIASQ